MSYPQFLNGLLCPLGSSLSRLCTLYSDAPSPLPDLTILDDIHAIPRGNDDISPSGADREEVFFVLGLEAPVSYSRGVRKCG